MIALILTVCLGAAPERCDDVRLTFDAGSVTLAQCTAAAMPQIAQWAGEHPQARVARWRCADPEREERPL